MEPPTRSSAGVGSSAEGNATTSGSAGSSTGGSGSPAVGRRRAAAEQRGAGVSSSGGAAVTVAVVVDGDLPGPPMKCDVCGKSVFFKERLVAGARVLLLGLEGVRSLLARLVRLFIIAVPSLLCCSMLLLSGSHF
jgi:hypothetical protein